MKRKRMSAGEIRFRISKNDYDRIEWLMKNHPDDLPTVSALLRSLITYEYSRYNPTDDQANDIVADKIRARRAKGK